MLKIGCDRPFGGLEFDLAEATISVCAKELRFAGNGLCLSGIGLPLTGNPPPLSFRQSFEGALAGFRVSNDLCPSWFDRAVWDCQSRLSLALRCGA